MAKASRTAAKTANSLEALVEQMARIEAKLDALHGRGEWPEESTAEAAGQDATQADAEAQGEAVAAATRDEAPAPRGQRKGR